ncbi:sodium-dependent transporter [Sediminibacillus albus]|uniref:Neurotransmitter:Na+ symporter, NSS family n=1 Tax=Sediminibacillus albus TaxID=407036 RepID=A0A1G8ZQC6_9BACI|nr:sodium-dependent transporter [Sediminibacillus albus]SDK16370.1 neurotransmitter:Na+ symporter, NSS family [Sediminibacillus albus]
MNSTRESWASKLGFMLAAMGSAVGLGNIWRFSYVAGENGGGAFLILYLVSILIIGVPLLLAEVSIGRKAQSDVVGSYQKLAQGKPWFMAGFLGVLGSLLILGFYSVVAGWSMYYFWNYLNGHFFTVPEEGYGAAFEVFTTSIGQPLFWHALFMVVTIAIVLTGVKKGIELANKIFMPTLAVLLIVLAGFSLSLEGAMEGMRFLFRPDWSVLSNPSVYIAALGQAFFSLSLGVGVMMTYGSYLSAHHKLPGATIGIGLMDTFFAIISGIVIFPAVFAFNIEPDSGPVLVFITLTDIFGQMPFGGYVGILFFLSLSLAAVSSSVSLLEVPVAYLMRAASWSRKKSAVIIGFVIFLLGIGASLGMGALSGFTPIGERNIMDSMDYVASNILLPIGGLVMALFIGWYFSKKEALHAADLTDSAVGTVWYLIVKFLAPVLILVIFMNALGVL